jgi:hypothetical protein
MFTKHHAFPRFQKCCTPLLTKNRAVSGILSFRATYRSTRRGSEQASALQETVQQKPGQQMLNKPLKGGKTATMYLLRWLMLRNRNLLYFAPRTTTKLTMGKIYSGVFRACEIVNKALTLSLLMSYISGAPYKERNFNIVYIYRRAFGNAESRLFLFTAQCFNIESMQKVFLCHGCV